MIPGILAGRKASNALIVKLADALSNNSRDDGSLILTSPFKKDISVNHLSFGYTPDSAVIKDISYTFHNGKSYALVGSSGSGKSTFMNLLMGAYDYTGSITYEDCELKNISEDSLYRAVTFVRQNVFLFNASLKDNITMYSDANENALNNAISSAGLQELVNERGLGYSCGENGSKLSGGERQRVSIARSLLRNSNVLLMDEATSALDTLTAKSVMDSVMNLKQMTRIIITHRLDEDELRRFDEIIVMKDGRIIESGDFCSLMDKKEYFYALFTLNV